MMNVLEERLAAVSWWVPWMREIEGTLFLLWCAVVLGFVGRGTLELLRLRRAKQRGDIGPQEHRWRSEARSSSVGWLALNGLLLVPSLFAILTLVGLFLVSLAASEDTAWNLQVLSGLVFWFFAYRWLYQRLRIGGHEPDAPDFGEDLPGEPILLTRSTATRNRR